MDGAGERQLMTHATSISPSIAIPSIAHAAEAFNQSDSSSHKEAMEPFAELCLICRLYSVIKVSELMMHFSLVGLAFAAEPKLKSSWLSYNSLSLILELNTDVLMEGSIFCSKSFRASVGLDTVQTISPLLEAIEPICVVVPHAPSLNRGADL